MRIKRFCVVVGVLLVMALLFNVPANAEEASEPSKETTTGYRMKPIMDKLSAMSGADIESFVNMFPDMKGHWSRTVVGKLTGLEIIKGMNDGNFYPENPVQADQFIKMTVLAMGYKVLAQSGYWAEPYIDIALSEGIIKKGEITDYTKPLTREQMARIIVRTAMKRDEMPDDRLDQFIIGKIFDYPKIEYSIAQDVITGYKLGLFQGSSGKFNPKSTLTRAEAAAVIIRFIDVSERVPMLPSEDEIIRTKDSRGNDAEVYPNATPELFTIAKAAHEAIPKAKGYVLYIVTPDGELIGAKLYPSKASYEASIFNMVAAFNISYNYSGSVYAYQLTVWNDEAYKGLFPDYIREIFKTLFEADANKAIALHDKYMNARYTRTDGLNDVTNTILNNRNVVFLRYNDNQFGIQIKLKGLK